MKLSMLHHPFGFTSFSDLDNCISVNQIIKYTIALNHISLLVGMLLTAYIKGNEI